MKILLLNDMAAPVGGAEILTFDLRSELRRRGHDARILASRALLGESPGPADFECFGTTSRLRTLNRTANPHAYWRLKRALSDFRPDVVHVRMFMTQLSPLVLPPLRSVPSLYHAVWYETICPTGHRLLPDRSICEERPGRACRRCLSPPAWSSLMLQHLLWERWRDAFDLFVANSETVRRRLVEHGIEPVVVVHNGVPRRPPRPPPRRPPLIAYAGRLTREKGVDVLLRAFQRVAAAESRARLIVIGDGPEAGALARSIPELGLEGRVTMTGHLPRRKMESMLDQAWIQVVPSLMEEPFGIAVAEAMMRGTPVVASNHGGPTEIVEDGRTGRLVPPDDPISLATALTGLLDDPDRAEAIGAAGRQWALEHLTREACVEKFLALYGKLIESNGAWNEPSSSERVRPV
ncbi:MAG TPA: glycosyltransferase family 4 protein [Gemmatimonadota bacterium]|nr:glycosyltransferase family 4 protein [Gemmatimonadota bacterium]